MNTQNNQQQRPMNMQNNQQNRQIPTNQNQQRIPQQQQQQNRQPQQNQKPREIKYYDLPMDNGQKQQQQSIQTFHFLSVLPQTFRQSIEHEKKFDTEVSKKQNNLMNSLDLDVIDSEYYKAQQLCMQNLENSEEPLEQRLQQLDQQFNEKLENKYQENLDENKKPDNQANKELFMKKRQVAIKIKEKQEKKRYIAQSYLRELERPQSNYGYIIIKRKADTKGIGAPTKFQLKFLDGSCHFEDEKFKNMAENSLYAEDMSYKQLQQQFIKKVDKHMKGKINEEDYKNQEESGVLNKRNRKTLLNDQDYDDYENFMGKKKVKNNDSDSDNYF